MVFFPIELAYIIRQSVKFTNLVKGELQLWKKQNIFVIFYQLQVIKVLLCTVCIIAKSIKFHTSIV